MKPLRTLPFLLSRKSENEIVVTLSRLKALRLRLRRRSFMLKTTMMIVVMICLLSTVA